VVANGMSAIDLLSKFHRLTETSCKPFQPWELLLAAELRRSGCPLQPRFAARLSPVGRRRTATAPTRCWPRAAPPLAAGARTIALCSWRSTTATGARRTSGWRGVRGACGSWRRRLGRAEGGEEGSRGGGGGGGVAPPKKDGE
jgi:hypothetical protein